MRVSLLVLALSACVWLLGAHDADAQSGGAFICRPGYDCVYEQVRAAFPATPMRCDADGFAGFTCDGQNVTMCKLGTYCPSTSPADATRCPDGHWCPQGFQYPIKCEPGATCPAGSNKQRQWVPIIALLVAGIVCTATYFAARRGYLTGAACGCGPAATPVKPPTPQIGGSSDKQQNGNGARVVNVAGVRVKPQGAPALGGGGGAGNNGRENSLTSGGADVSFMMSGGMRTSIVFDDVSIEVGTGPFRRTVLHHLTGKFQSGRLSAIMGPSGSGKSTAMNALTGRIKLAKGSVTLNGVTPLSKLDKIVGFVGQEDIMLPMLTVRQVLVDNALARLPVVWPLRKKLAIVDDVLEVLHLTKIADSVIGDVSERGISGGEKKRVSVGMELVADPAVLFLDEPTSGLDASSAKDLMAALQRVAQRGLIVVSVIHQPRTEIFQMIDDLLLLRTGGFTVYFGEAAAAEPYFTWLGFPLPPNCNPADHQLDVVSGRVPLRLLPPGQSALSPPPATPTPSNQKDDEKQLHTAVSTTQGLAVPGLDGTPATAATPALTITVAPMTAVVPTTAVADANGANGNANGAHANGGHRGSDAPPKAKGVVAIPSRDVPKYLTESWLNYRLAFATGKTAAIERDVDVKCTQKQIDGVMLNSAPPQLLALAAGTGLSVPQPQPQAHTPTGRNLVDAAVTSTIPVSLATLTLPAMIAAPIPLPGAPAAGAAPAAAAAGADAGAAPTVASVPGGGNELELTSIRTPAASVNGAKDERPVTADAKEKEAMQKAEAALIEDVVAVRQPPGFIRQTYLYLKRRLLVDVRAPFPTILDIGLQVLSGFALASGGSGREYYSPPLPLAVAETCPDILRDRCIEKAIFGFPVTYMGFFTTMVICVACSNFAVRTFGQWMNVWNRERLCGRDLKAYFMAQILYDLLHVTRSALFFAACFTPTASYRGAFGWWYLSFWLLIFACHGMGYFVSVAISYQLSTVVTVVLGVALSITSGLTPPLDVVKDWWPLPIFWSISYNRWGAEALVNLALKAQSSAPSDRVDTGIRALGYDPDNFALDLGMLAIIGVMWRVFAFLRLKYRKASV